jgi:hypothetical protein
MRPHTCNSKSCFLRSIGPWSYRPHRCHSIPRMSDQRRVLPQAFSARFKNIDLEIEVCRVALEAMRERVSLTGPFPPSVDPSEDYFVSKWTKMHERCVASRRDLMELAKELGYGSTSPQSSSMNGVQTRAQANDK